MNYTLLEIGEGSYTTYFFNRRHKYVYAIKSNGMTCNARMATDYQDKFSDKLNGLCLSSMNTRLNELPKYIENNLTKRGDE